VSGTLPPTVDGRPADPATLAALALGNYGHFTTMRVEDRAVRGLSLHLERLARDCAVLFGTDLDTGHVRELIRRAVAGDRSARVLRVTVFDPAIGVVSPAGDAEPVVLITGRSAVAGPRTPLRVATTPYVRDLPAIKHTGLFAVAAHRRAAIRAGHDDVLLLGPTGLIAEGATWNVGFHDGAGVVWPQRDCLPGITVALLNRAGVAHSFGDVRPDDLPRMRAVFSAASTAGIRPIGAVDGVPVPTDDAVIGELAAAYAAVEPEPLG
jgi:branched-subunit amino acid aminotransferase/4-amino-4-deoxychorismate lyase